MRSLFFILFFVSFFSNAQDLKEIRSLYPQAVESSEITSKIEGKLSSVTSSSKPILKAYKGAVLTLKAKFSKKKSEKKEFFKEGAALIESAVKDDSSNIETRYIRMSVQGNSPKFLGYHKDIEEDKQFILNNYAAISSKELKEIVKDYMAKSENFTEKEMAEFR